MNTKKNFHFNVEDEMNLLRRKTDEEIINELGLDEFKPLSDEQRNKINVEYLKEIGINRPKYQRVVGLIGSKGFLVRSNHFITKLSPRENNIVNNFAYRRICMEIAKCGNMIKDMDSSSFYAINKAINELKSKDYMDTPTVKNIKNINLYHKQSQLQYLRDNIEDEEQASMHYNISEFKEFLKVNSYNFEDIKFYLTNFGEAKVINNKEIKIDNLFEIPLEPESPLPDIAFNYKVYPISLELKVNSENEEELIFIDHNINLYLIFLNGQNKLLK